MTRPSVPSQKCRNSNIAGPGLVWPSTSRGRRRSEDRNAEAPWPAPAGWSPPARQHGPRWQQAPTLHSILLYVVYTEPRYCRKLKYFSCTGCPVKLFRLCFCHFLGFWSTYRGTSDLYSTALEICYMIGTRIFKFDLEIAEIIEVKVGTYNTKIIF